MILKQSTVYNRVFLMVLSSDHVTGATGLSPKPAVSLSKNAQAFAGAAGAVTEIANGLYYVALTAADTNTIGDLAVHCTAATCDPTDFVDQVNSQIFPDLALNPSGLAIISSNVKQNAALTGFMFVMTLIGSNLPATGLTVTAQRSLAGAGFAPCANSVTELSNGVYTINLATTDTNAGVVMLRFTATGANDQNILLITQP